MSAAPDHLTFERFLRDYGPYWPEDDPPTDEEIHGRLELAGQAIHQLPSAVQREHARQTWIDYFKEHTLPGCREPWRIVQAAIDAGRSIASTQLGAPLTIPELVALEEPEIPELVEGIIPADGNVLLAGYPKTHKTNLVLALTVALGTGRPWLGRFPVARRCRVGCVWMEDREFRIRRRLRRLCEGFGLGLEALDGHLWQWFRPPLRLSNAAMLDELGGYVAAHALDVLWVDSYAYVADGDSNSADDVVPQLVALSGIRTARPGLTVGLTHHARKVQGDDEAGQRLTDRIRGSGSFGAWYDAGLLLGRRDERAPVIVRAELRDAASPEPFAFTVTDEVPADPAAGTRAGGWLKVVALEQPPWLVEREEAARRVLPAVLEYVTEHDGCSHRAVRDGVDGKNDAIDAALKLGESEGLLSREPPGGPGKPSRWRRIGGCAPPCPHRAPARSPDTVPPVPHPPLGGGPGHGPGGTGGEGVPLGHSGAESAVDPVAELPPKVRRELERWLIEMVRGRPDLGRAGILRAVPIHQHTAAERMLDGILTREGA